MRTRRVAAAAVATTFVAGCASYYESIQEPLPSKLAGQDLSKVSKYDLCVDYNRSTDRTVLGEIRKRDFLQLEDLQSLTSGVPTIGMTPLGAVCLYGRPETINDTTTANSRSEQWVYCSDHMLSPKLRPENIKGSWLADPSTFRCDRHAYLYFNDGRLAVHQNVPAAWRPPAKDE